MTKATRPRAFSRIDDHAKLVEPRGIEPLTS